MWTSEQAAAIELRHANLLISAAAGSGKTAVLVERVIQLILNAETSVDRLLVVTYTNAAAGEMRGRIEKALSEAIEQNRGDKKHLSEQIKLLSHSSIKTFHAFCLDVIRAHFQKIDIDPNFRMINDNERLLMLESAMEDTLERAYEALEPAFVQLVEAFSGNRDDLKLRKMILQLYQFILAHPNPKTFLDAQRAVYADETHPVRQQWAQVITAHFQQLIENGIEHIEEAIELCQYPGGPTPYIATLQSDREKLRSLEEAAAVGMRALEQTVADLKLDRIASIRKADRDQYDEGLIEQVKGYCRDKVVKKQVLEVIKNFFSYKSYDRFNEEIQALQPHIDALCDLTEDFMRRYTSAKRAENLMDFSDLEHFAIEILDDAAIAALYRAQFDFIFVDEYQDASAIQEHIVQAIKRMGNVFMVGDVKQSIYKFRLADPNLFIEKYKRFTHYDTLSKKGEKTPEAVNAYLSEQLDEQFVRVDLRCNFRTRPEVLDSVNNVFENIMSEALGDIVYDDAAKLYGKMAFEDTGAPAVTATVISKKGIEEEDDVLTFLKTDEIEARHIAHMIKKTVGTPVYFPKEKQLKPCRYADIAVLLRSTKSWTPVFEQVFIEEGVPLYTESQTGYFDTLEIKWLMALLKTIDNPLNDLELLTVLRSPFVGLDINALAAIKTAAPEGAYYDKVNALASGDGPSAEKLTVFLKRLKIWQKQARYLPLDELLWTVIETSDIAAYVSCMPGGVARCNNLALLVERAVGLKQSKLFTLPYFIAFIEEMIASNGDMGTSKNVGEGEDVVKLMSIHKSKGLEFPIVILSGLGRKFNQLDTTGDFIYHKQLGLALPFVDVSLRTKTKTLPQFALKEQIKRETLSEEMRVLYVGMTRAVDRMIVVTTVADAKKRITAWERPYSPHGLYHATGFCDWVQPTFMADETVVTAFVEPSDLVTDEVVLSRRQDEQLAALQLKCLEADSTWVTPRFKMPPRGLSGQMPVKRSVSELKEDSRQTVVLAEAPSFVKPTPEMQSAKIGEVVHALLERLPFREIDDLSGLKSFVEDTCTRLGGDPDIYGKINLFKILAFLKSDLGIRIKTAQAVYRETPFVYEESGQLVQGVVDLYFEEADGFVVVDYKTDGLKGRTLDEVVAPHGAQVSYYARAIEGITGKKVKEKYIYFINLEKVYRVAE